MDIPLQHLLVALSEGVQQLQQRVEGLEAENQQLHLRKESLERQVMDMANEPMEALWQNVIVLYDEQDDEPDSAA